MPPVLVNQHRQSFCGLRYAPHISQRVAFSQPLPADSGLASRSSIHMCAAVGTAAIVKGHAMGILRKAVNTLFGTFGMTALAAVGAIITAAVKFYGIGRPKIVKEAPPSPPSAETSFAQTRYEMGDREVAVNRTVVDEQLSAYLDTGVGQYAVVLGPRGTGKSFAVTNALDARQGVVQLTLGDTLSVGSLYSKVLQMAGLGQYSSTADLEEQLTPFMRTATRLYRAANPDEGDESTWLPTLVVDVADGTAPHVAASALKLVKMLAVDERVARAVVILCEPNSISAVTDDPDRQKLLWVGDLTDEEAHAFLDTRCCLLPSNVSAVAEENAALRQALIRQVGTRPSTLTRVCDLLLQPDANASTVVHSFVKARRRLATIAVGALIAVDDMEQPDSETKRGMRFRTLLKQMLDDPDAALRCEDAPYMAPAAAVMEARAPPFLPPRHFRTSQLLPSTLWAPSLPPR
uniref:Uncharacterized protein n=1 Tax=Chrysotila carterae TaxID=13221 RepID=A0A7S4B6U4_CHRCT